MKPTDADPNAPKRAAAYVRMSTEHQQYSTLNQLDLIREYAELHGLEIVKIYSDDGKSGLNIKGRAALAQMIADVTNGDAGYGHILVYDVTRWGRFQDADESAHYEYLCRRAGVAVHFCAEDFKSDGSMSSTLYKGIKRVFAGDYSRVLSEKVFRGACRLIGLGFRQGGAAGFGLRRMLLDHAGHSKGLLKIGEKKSIQTDRVVLVLGPGEEVETVRWMYQSFVGGGKREAEIAADLNERGILTDFGRKWTRGTVHEVLTNEKYIGNNIYHRTSFKLKHTHVKNPRDKWVRADGVFTALVDPNVFDVAQRMILFRSRKFSNDEMLEKLRGVLAKHGRITGLLIDEEDDAPSSSAFRQRFGSLVRAYQLIGYTPEIDFSFIETNRVLRERHSTVVGEVVAKLRELGAVVVQDTDTGLLTLDSEWNVSLVIARHRATGAGFSRWLIRFDAGLKPDITVAVRMAPGNKEIKDYYLLARSRQNRRARRNRPIHHVRRAMMATAATVVATIHRPAIRLAAMVGEAALAAAVEALAAVVAGHPAAEGAVAHSHPCHRNHRNHRDHQSRRSLTCQRCPSKCSWTSTRMDRRASSSRRRPAPPT